MPATLVFATTGGHRYHATADCRALNGGQVLYGGWGDLPVYRPRETTAVNALGEGKTPCCACIPGSGAALAVSSCEEDFGHEPRWVGEAGYCPRCSWDTDSVISWPCTSAVVLGLAERQVTR
jgi:hypothetical protein